jgi:hypothetical protein
MSRFNWNKLSLAIGAGGVVAALLATTPALGAAGRTPAAPALTGVVIKSVTNGGPVALAHPPFTTQVLKLSLPAGKWALSAKMWGDSVPQTTGTNTLVRCSLKHGGTFLDVSAFNIPRIGGVTSAGVIYLGAVVSLKATGTVVVFCDDLNSDAEVINAEMTAIG